MTDITLQAEQSSDSATTYYLALWQGDDPVLRINPWFWDRSALAQMLRRLVEQRPAIRVSPDASPYLAHVGGR